MGSGTTPGVSGKRTAATYALALAAALPPVFLQARPFLRGDADSSGSLNVTDAVWTLGFLLRRSPTALPCEDAADVDDSGALEVSDAVALLRYLFQSGPEPPTPFPYCGRDPTADELTCRRSPACPEATPAPLFVSGRALGPDGKPAQGAAVVVASKYRGQTDAQGRFLVGGFAEEGVPFGVLVRLESGGGELRARVLELERPANGNLDLGTVWLGYARKPIYSGPKYPVGASRATPVAAASGDINADGVLDLAVANNREVAVLLGQPDGGFVRHGEVFFGLGRGATGVVLEDLDANGTLDMAIAIDPTDVIRVVLGDGAGGFRPVARIPVPNLYFLIGVGDLDRDGNGDIAAWGPLSPNVKLLFGGGDGSFGNLTQLNVGPNVADVLALDANGDGITDIVTADCDSNDLTVFLGAGDGTFRPARRIPGGVCPLDIAGGDIDGDSVADLIVLERGGERGIQVLIGDGSGAFTNINTIAFSLIDPPASVELGDFNGDGMLDIAAVRPAGATVDLLLGDGDGGFRPWGRYPVGLDAKIGVLSDFDGDGVLDLTVANRRSGDLSVILNPGAEEAPPLLRYPMTDAPYGVALGDANGDGPQDLLVLHYGSRHFSLFPGRGDATFGEAIPVPRRLEVVADVLLADVNGDGTSEIFIVYSSIPEVDIVGLAAGGAFEPLGRLELQKKPQGAAFGDLNRDGDLDLVLGGPNIGVLFGNGDGSFSSDLWSGPEKGAVEIALGDFSGEGITDVAMLSSVGAELTVVYGREEWVFDAGETYGLDPRAQDVAAGDFNADGRDDIVVAIREENSVRLFLSEGGEGFSEDVALGVGKAPFQVAAVDLDGDGNTDVVTCNKDSGDVSVLRGRGDGTFENEIRFPAVRDAQSFDFADINGDGRLDLAVGGPLAREVSVLLSR